MKAEVALHLAVTVPIAAGVLALLIPRALSVLTKLIAVAVSALVFIAAIKLYALGEWAWAPEWANGQTLLGLDGLSAFMLLGTGFFSLAMALYSAGFLRDEQVSPRAYYASFLWVVGCACATLLARHMLVLLFFWAAIGIPFFLLINLGTGAASAAAKKTLIVLGATDSILIIGIALVHSVSGSFDMAQTLTLELPATVVACLCFAVAAFAKAGAMPFHSWVPDACETAPVPAVALLPASLDKLLGIYLFARVSMTLFELDPALRALFVLVGAVTVMAAVMAALVQHNLRRLLGFHAVSQVGYMVMGIATGTPVGVLGGLFHMVNNALYKSCLFLTAGAAERRSGTGELDGMGGMAKAMPLTFAAALIAALAISGVPPLNGFVSKWMVYQGLIEMGKGGGYLWVVALVAAMFGSALTLASFVKVLHSVFLGQPRAGVTHTGPTPNVLMALPMAVLAVVCVAFGVLAYGVPMKLLLPALPESLRTTTFIGAWQPGIATLLLCVALLAGGVIYLLGSVKVREDEAYVGGEAGAKGAQFRFSGVDFYRTVTQVPTLNTFYKDAEQGWYDLYHLGRRLVGWVALPLQALHSGLLLSYVAWFVLGMIVLLWVFLH